MDGSVGKSLGDYESDSGLAVFMKGSLCIV
jgi:hypothetical protein